MTYLGSEAALFVERTACPLCHSVDLIAIFASGYESSDMRQFLEFEQTFGGSFWGEYERGLFNGYVFKVVKCRTCDFLFQSSVLNDAGMKLLYDKWVDPQATLERHQRRDLTFKRSVGYSQRLNIVIKHFSGVERPEMLDWGSGFGDFCVMAKSYGVDIAALEFSEERASHLESRGIRIVTPDGLKEKHYHFINLDQVLEHVTEPVALLRQIRHYLRDDGILCVSTPRCVHIEKNLKTGMLTQRVFDCLSMQHINAFTNKSLKKACKAAGFSVLFTVNPQPVAFSRCNWRRSVAESLKNVGRPFSQYFTGTSFFLQKQI